MVRVNKLFVELPPGRHKVALFIEEMFSIVEQEKHRSIGASQAIQYIFHPGLKALCRQRGVYQPNVLENITQEEFEGHIGTDHFLFTFGKLTEDNIVPWDMLLKICRNAMQLGGLANSLMDGFPAMAP